MIGKPKLPEAPVNESIDKREIGTIIRAAGSHDEAVVIKRCSDDRDRVHVYAGGITLPPLTLDGARRFAAALAEIVEREL